MNKVIALLTIVFVFVFVFFATTAITDMICQLNGYYEVGIQESAEFYQ